MNSEIYQRVMDEYRLRREKDLQIEEARRSEVFAACPEIGELWERRHALIMDGLGSILTAGKTVDPEKVMLEYNGRIRSLLEAHGYPGDYLEPVYRCPLCRDTGLTGDGIKVECACFRRRVRELEQREALDAEGPESFDRYDTSVFSADGLDGKPFSQRELMNIIAEKCRDFADSYPDGPVKNLVLHGNTGLGKTWLLKCVARRLRDRGVDTLYTTAYRLLDDLRADYFRPGTRDTAGYFRSGMLLIDDLGMEPLFDNVTVEIFFNVLNERTLAGLGTCVSTNLSLTEIKKRYTERFTSRLLDRRLSLEFELLGTDLRMSRS